MRGKLFFIGICAFSFGILCRSLFDVLWQFVALAFFIAALCFALSLFERDAEKDLRPIVAGLVLCLFALGVIRTSLVLRSIPDAFLPLMGQQVSFVGTIITDPDIRETSTRLTVEVWKENQKTRIIAAAPPFRTFALGEQVRIAGVLKKPEPFSTDGGRTFAYDAFLTKDGIFGIVQPASVTVIARSSGIGFTLWGFLLAIKNKCVRALGIALPEPYASLAVGLIAGGKQGLGPDLLAAFTVAGLLQVVVLSGYNVMIVAEGILRSLSRLPKNLALTIAASAIVLFVIAAGANSSAVRAGIMALLALSARATGRSYDVMRALFAALFLMLLLNPLLLAYDPGFQFSFLATVGLIIGSPFIAIRLLWIRSVFIREMLATTIAAQMAVLPILLWQSGNLSIVALPANLLVMPLVPSAMAFSAVAACIVWLVPALGPLAGLPAYVFLWCIIEIAKISARIPFAQMIIPEFSFGYVVFAYTLLFFLVRRFKLPRSRSASR